MHCVGLTWDCSLNSNTLLAPFLRRCPRRCRALVNAPAASSHADPEPASACSSACCSAPGPLSDTSSRGMGSPCSADSSIPSPPVTVVAQQLPPHPPAGLADENLLAWVLSTPVAITKAGAEARARGGTEATKLHIPRRVMSRALDGVMYAALFHDCARITDDKSARLLSRPCCCLSLLFSFRFYQFTRPACSFRGPHSLRRTPPSGSRLTAASGSVSGATLHVH